MKGNLLLGTARGKLGDVVFYRQRSKQMARVRVTKVANPRTLPQVVQRVVFNTCIQAYSAMQDICNHSFQGMERSVENQAEFMRINVRLLNNQIAASSNPKLCRAFLRKEDKGLVLNGYQISKGNLPTFISESTSETDVALLVTNTSDTNFYDYTYQSFSEALGVPVGSQITICLVIGYAGDPSTPNLFTFGRFVLSPADGDVNKKIFDSATSTTTVLQLNDPNPDNTINFFSIIERNTVKQIVVSTLNDYGESINSSQFYGFNRRSGDLLAYSFIVSQYVNGVWRRSDSFLRSVVSTDEFIPDQYYTLEEAADSYEKGVWSSRYLNQGTQDGGLLGVEDEWNGIKERYPQQYAMSEAMAYDGEGEAETQDPEGIAKTALTRKRCRKDTE